MRTKLEQRNNCIVRPLLRRGLLYRTVNCVDDRRIWVTGNSPLSKLAIGKSLACFHVLAKVTSFDKLE
jgi:hypothetical protein